MTHILKTHPAPFQALRRGDKNFEFRKFDRPFDVGHKLELREFDPLSNTVTGEVETRIITYMLIGPEFGVPAGFCVMALK